MGMETVLVGYIAECWLGGDENRTRLLRRSNRRILSALPEEDSWPPLTKGLFAWSDEGGMRGGYRGTIIHFGGRFKSIETDWDEWLIKYESLLKQLYWESSTVFLDTEVSGQHRFDWYHSNYDDFILSPPKLPTSWEFKGPFRNWSEVGVPK